ncbi:unnamed protein product, partial [Symbiodinium sp. KB8]
MPEVLQVSIVGGLKFNASFNDSIDATGVPDHENYITSDSSFVVAWLVDEPHSPYSCRVAVGSRPDFDDVFTGVFAGPVWGTNLPSNATTEDGTVLFAKVECINAAELSDSGSSGFAAVDRSPPEEGFVWFGLYDAAVSGARQRSLQWWNDETTIQFHWSGFQDQHSPIVSFDWCVGWNSSICLWSGSLDPEMYEFELSGLSLDDGQGLVATVTATNGAGLSTAAVSALVLVDASPPDVVNATVALGLDTSSHRNTSSEPNWVPVSWKGFADSLSGVTHYHVEVLTSEDSVLGEHAIESFGADFEYSVVFSTSEMIHDLPSYHFTARLRDPVPDGAEVYAVVTAVDALGQESSVVSETCLFDATPPEGSVIVEVIQEANTTSPIDLDEVNSNPLMGGLKSNLAFMWEPFIDNETAVVGYEVALFTFDENGREAVIVPFGWLGDATVYRPASIEFEHGHTYFIRVRGHNPTGLTTEVASNGIRVDNTSPMIGRVFDGKAAATASAVTIVKSAELEPSGILLFNSTGNGTGLAPQPAEELVWEYHDLDVQAGWHAISAHWTPFADPESDTTYAWCIGSVAFTDDVFPCTDVGGQLSATVYSSDPLFNASAILTQYGIEGEVEDDEAWLAAVPRNTSIQPIVFITVIATNEVGLEASASSNGLSFDAIPPTSGAVYDGAEWGALDIDEATPLRPLGAWWDGFSDSQTGLSHYEVAVEIEGSDKPVFGPFDNGLDTTWTGAGLALEESTIYHIRVTAVDAVGHRASAVSNGVIIDASGPVPVLLTDCITEDCIDDGLNAFMRPCAPDSTYSTLPKEEAMALLEDAGIDRINSSSPSISGHIRLGEGAASILWMFAETETAITNIEWSLCPSSASVFEPTSECLFNWTVWNNITDPLAHLELSDIGFSPSTEYEAVVRIAALQGYEGFADWLVGDSHSFNVTMKSDPGRYWMLY